MCDKRKAERQKINALALGIIVVDSQNGVHKSKRDITGAMSVLANRLEIDPRKIVEDRRVEKQAVETVEQSSVTGQNARGILCLRAALHSAFG